MKDEHFIALLVAVGAFVVGLKYGQAKQARAQAAQQQAAAGESGWWFGQYNGLWGG